MPCDFSDPNKKARNGFVKDAMQELIINFAFENKNKDDDQVKAMCLAEMESTNAKPKSK
jgi:hypothetical protein